MIKVGYNGAVGTTEARAYSILSGWLTILSNLYYRLVFLYKIENTSIPDIQGYIGLYNINLKNGC